MRIEIEENINNIKVNDHTIRDLLIDIEDKDIKDVQSKHFQAVLSIPNKRLSNLTCVLAYYDCNNSFLGLDEDSVWLDKEDSRVEILVSMRLNIPEGAERSVFSVKASSIEDGFYFWAWRIATVTLILTSVVWLIGKIQNIL